MWYLAYYQQCCQPVSKERRLRQTGAKPDGPVFWKNRFRVLSVFPGGSRFQEI